MSLTLEQYLALSVFDYDKLKSGDKDKAIGKFLNKINKDDNNKLIPELGVLSQIQNWVLIGYTKNTASGMGAVAFQNPDTKEIVIAYRGTHGIERNIKEAIKDYEADLAIASGDGCIYGLTTALRICFRQNNQIATPIVMISVAIIFLFSICGTPQIVL